MPAEEVSPGPREVISFHGLSLEQYAGVRAAITEELPLNAVLANEELDPAVWPKADAAWTQRLAEDGPEGALFQAYREKLSEAEDWLVRRVTPLDSDLEAWLAFLHAWSESPTPFELLTSAGLRMNDISRLQRRWARRMEQDTSLPTKAAEIVKASLGPLPTIRADAAKLRAFPWSKGGKPSPTLVSPSLAATGVGNVDMFSLDRYAALVAALAYRPLDRSQVLDDHSLTPVTFEALDQSWKQRLEADSTLKRDYRALYGQQQARLRIFSGQVDGERSEVPPLLAAPLASPPPRVPQPSPVPVAVPSTDTAPLLDGPREPALPEVSTVPMGELWKGPALPFTQGSTPAEDASPLSLIVSTEQHAPERSDDTAPLPPLRRKPVLPFEAKHSRAPDPELRPVHEADTRSETAPIVLAPRGPALPFSIEPARALEPAAMRPPEELPRKALSSEDPMAPQAPSANAPEAPPPLTMEQHASLWVELSRAPKRTEETLTRYGLTRERQAQADLYWREQIGKHPELRAAWDRSYQIYDRWFLKRGQEKR